MRRIVTLLLVCLTCTLPSLARAGTFSLPLRSLGDWQILSYRTIPSNDFHASSEGLLIHVDRSASPAVFKLPHAMDVVGLQVSGRILSGRMNVSPEQQGKSGSDDYSLRVGLVEAGSHKLNLVERMLGSLWLSGLNRIVPPGVGVSGVQFYNVGTASSQIGRTLQSPWTGLFHQTVVAVPDDRGQFTFRVPLAPPATVLAIWIASDGNETHSTFDVLVQSLELITVP